jgi:glycine/D-amino acid oxidase-like deaminating enzyme
MKTYYVDVVIMGGGVAGLFLLDRLRKQGYHAILLESRALGSGQTINSQGIIHGGVKYALSGKLTNASESIAAMPARWQDFLKGEGETDLSAARVLSPSQYLWSNGKMLSRMTAFMASKALRSRAQLIKKNEFPSFFNHQKFRGEVYRLEESVLDVPSIIKNLYDLQYQWIYHYDNLLDIAKGDLVNVQLDHCHVRTKDLILTAGEGNEALLKKCQLDAPRMQRRPLHMMAVKHPDLRPLYAHCLGASAVPFLTVSTHETVEREKIWYLGGDLAEKGVSMDASAQIVAVRACLEKLFPQTTWERAEFLSHKINRAEMQQAKGARPDGPLWERQDNVWAAWPTKLTFSPLLADQVLEALAHNNRLPTYERDVLPLKNPPLATPFWENSNDWRFE